MVCKALLPMLIMLMIATPTYASYGYRGDAPPTENNDYDSTGDGSYEGDYPPPPPEVTNRTITPTETDSGMEVTDLLHDKLKEVLTRNRDSVTELLDSDYAAHNDLFDDLNKLTEEYWLLDEVYATLKSKREEYGKKGYDGTTLESIDEVLDVLKEEMVDLPKHEYNGKQNKLDVLNNSKSVMDCSLNRSSRNKHFGDIEDSVYVSDWECTTAIPSLWWDLVNADYKGKKCDLKQALKSVLDIVQEFQGKDDERFVLTIKLDYVLALSKPKHVDYLKTFLCNQSSPEECHIYQDMLCKPLKYNEVAHATNLINAGLSGQEGQIDPENMFTLLDVQQSLGDVTNKLTSIKTVRTSVEKEVSQKLLESYLGIIDTAIGNTSIETWKQTKGGDTLNQFKKMLVNTEEFVGYTANIVLRSGTKNVTVEKDTLSVLMREVDKDANVSFTFRNAEIWTDVAGDEQSGSKFNVYALFYNSWHENLKRIVGGGNLTLNLNESIAKSSGHNNRTSLVGRGGIISLSTRTHLKKKSLPVTFKMYFDEEEYFSNENNPSINRCLSCGFLDVTSGAWRTDGCVAIAVDKDSVTCHCNHTTNFAAFMTPFETGYNATESEKLGLEVLEYIGSAASSIGLILSCICFYIVRNTVRNDRLRAHMNLSLAFLFVHLIQLGADYAVENNTACEVVTVTTHFFLLSSFMWMLVEGVFLYFYVVQVFMLSRIENRRWMYIIGWGIPLVIVGISAGYGFSYDLYVEPRKQSYFTCENGQKQYPPPNGDTSELKYAKCWLSVPSHMIWSFVAPAMCVIVFNIAILSKVILVLVKLSGRSNGMRNFQVSNHSSYQAKARPSVQVHTAKSVSQEMTVSEHCSNAASYGDKAVLNNEPLHGHVVTHVGGNLSSSRSNSHSNQNALVRPRASVSPTVKDNNFLSDMKTAVKGAVVLLPLLGISWVIGVFSGTSYALSVLFVLLNATQGVAIFFVYVVFNGEVCRALQRHMELRRLGRYNSARGRTSSTSSLKSAFNRSLLGNWKRRSTAVSTLSSNTHSV